MPNMAIVDADIHDDRSPRASPPPPASTLLTHALEAYASVMATDYTDGLALQRHEADL